LNLLAFSLLDWLVLAALPWLGLSYGPFELPLAGLVIIRSAAITGFLILTLIAHNLLGDAATKMARRLPFIFLGVNLAIFACEFEAFYFEPFFLRTTYLERSAPAVFSNTDLNATNSSLRIVQLSDTHIEFTTRRERDLIKRIHDLRPDIILLTGDYLNLSYLHDPQSQSDGREFFSQLHAPYGIYAVTGSVDPPAVVSPVFDGLEITFLYDEVRQIDLPQGKIYLLGISNQWLSRDQDILVQLMQPLPDNAYSILLYHTPDLIEIAASNDVNLTLSGHTHGGQIRLPFYGALFTGSIYGKKYEAGRYQVGPTTLYVSRGIGMEGSYAPRARFLCPPEIVVIDLVP